MSNEIGDLKIKVGVEVDAKKAIQQNEAAAEKTANIWEKASEAIKKRNEAMATSAAAALLDRGVAPFQVGDDPVAHLQSIRAREQAEKDASDATQKAAADDLAANKKATAEIWKSWEEAAKKRESAEKHAAETSKQKAEDAKKAHEAAAKKSAEKWKQAFSQAGQIIAGAVAGAAAGIAVFAQNLYASGVAISRQSQQLGVSAQEFQRWGYIAEQTGLEQQGLVASLAHLQQQAAADGDMRSASELFQEMADRIQVLGPGTESTALAMQSFGEQGRALLPVLLQGRVGIARLGDEFDALGGGLDQETIDAMVSFDHEMGKAKQELMALVMPLVREAIPAFRKLATEVREGIKSFTEWIANSHNARTAVAALGAVLVAVGVAAAVAWGPVILIIAGVAAACVVLGLAIDDVATAFEGGDSAIGAFVDSMFGVGTTTEIINTLKDAWVGLQEVFAAGSGAADMAAEWGPLKTVLGWIKGAIGWLAEKVPQVIGFLLRMHPLALAVRGLAGAGRERRAREERAATQRTAPAATAAPAGYGVLMASPTLSASPSGATAGTSSRVVHGNQRVTVNVSGVLDPASTRAIGEVVNQAVAEANQATADELGTTANE